MADATKLGSGIWGELGDLIGRKTKELSSKIDLSGLKVPTVKAEGELGGTTKIILGVAVLLFGIWIFKAKR